MSSKMRLRDHLWVFLCTKTQAPLCARVSLGETFNVQLFHRGKAKMLKTGSTTLSRPHPRRELALFKHFQIF